MANHPPESVINAIREADSFLVVTHIYPDGDALGSQIAMGNILRSLGKQVYLYSEETVPNLYAFLPGCEGLDTALPDLKNIDCVIALDCGDRLRLGKAMDNLLAVHPFVMIDHHTGKKKFGDHVWVDSQRASTGEMVYDIAVALDADIDTDTAYCLYTAIVSDTGSFKYSSTTSETFRIAGELIAKGVRPSDVAGKLFDNFSVNRLQLLKAVLATLNLHGENSIAIIHVTQDMFEETATIAADTENFINYPRSLASVKVAAFIKETQTDLISVSLRSKGKECDVAVVASKFGGGGHRNAAGFKIRAENIADVQEKLLQELLPLAAGH